MGTFRSTPCEETNIFTLILCLAIAEKAALLVLHGGRCLSPAGPRHKLVLLASPATAAAHVDLSRVVPGSLRLAGDLPDLLEPPHPRHRFAKPQTSGFSLED